jgi:hypothetical protein
LPAEPKIAEANQALIKFVEKRNANTLVWCRRG